MADFNFNRDMVNSVNQRSREEWEQRNQAERERQNNYLENLQKYTVQIPQEQYDIINNAISNAEIPEDEAYRWASAFELERQYHIPLDYAYKNQEQIISSLWQDKYQFTPKTAFKAIVDSGRLGVNTVKQAGIGSAVMAAELAGKNVDDLLAQYEEIEKENEGLYDYMDRNFFIDALKFGAQSAPFTGYVAGAGLLGSLIAPGVGTAAGFAASMQQASGLQYMQLRKAGATTGNAFAFSLIDGALEAIVETSLGNVAGAMGKSALGAAGKQAAVEQITANVFKRLHYSGTIKSLALKLGSEYVKENFEEGMEEVIQGLISAGTEALSAELGNYNIDGKTAGEVAKEAWENFYGGIAGSLVLGLPTSAIKVRSDLKSVGKLKQAAKETESFEVFKENNRNNPVLENIEESEKTETLRNIWDKAQDEAEQDLKLRAKEYGEVLGTSENFEEENVDDETGDTITSPEYRNSDTGGLYAQNVVTGEENGKTTGIIGVGDPTKETKNKYAEFRYTLDEANNTVTIDDIKVAKSRLNLRDEVFDTFARNFPGMEIQWNAIGKVAQEWKAEFEQANPQGKNAGLKYYNSINDISDSKTRTEIVKQMKDAYKKAGRTLTNDQAAANVVILESLYRRLREQQDFKDRGIDNFSKYISYTFGDNIFGEGEIATNAAKQKFGPNAVARGGSITRSLSELDRDIKAIVYVTKEGDFSTFSHEIAHIARKQLTGELLKQVEDVFGVEEGNWTVEKEEKFAYGFEQFLREGKVENEALRPFYEKVAQFLVDCFDRLKQLIDMTPDIEKTYNDLLSKGDNSVLAAAQKAVEQSENAYRAAEQQRQRQEEIRQQEEETKQKAAEQEQKDEESEVILDDEEKELTWEEKNAAVEANDAAAREYYENIAPEKIKEAQKKMAKRQDATPSLKMSLESLLGLPDSYKKYTTIQSKLLQFGAKDVWWHVAQVEENRLADIYKDEQIRRLFGSNDNLTTEEKNKIEETLNDPEASIQEKTQAADDAAESAYDDFPIFQLIGELGATNLDRVEEVTTRMDNLEVAKEMFKAGKFVERIRFATGWEMGADAKWRYEVMDGEFKNIHEANLLSDADNFKMLKLSELFDAPELYKAYPELRNMYVYFDTHIDQDFAGTYSPATDSINFPLKSYETLLENIGVEEDEITGEQTVITEEAADYLRGVLVHEIQHAIQERENFARGSNKKFIKENPEATELTKALASYSGYSKEELEGFTAEKARQLYLNMGITEEELAQWSKDIDGLGTIEEIIERDIRDHGVDWTYDEIQSAKQLADRAGKVEIQGNVYSSPYEAYRAAAGEVEARNVQRRLNMSELDRLNTLLFDTEDIDRNEQWIYKTAVEMASEEVEKIETERQEEAVRKQYENTDKWLKAPNGKDTNLTEKQWLQTRTDNFKRWFGDWENDPANASKVVDENGEPKVVYHGTKDNFTTFSTRKTATPQFWFTDSKKLIERGEVGAAGKGIIMPVFLDIKKPAGWHEEDNFGIDQIIARGFDGKDLTDAGVGTYVAFNPNQIKSATDNNGNFDANNPSILFQNVVDLTDAFPDGIKTDKDLREFLAKIAESNEAYETDDNNYIGIENNNEKIRHLEKGKNYELVKGDRRLKENRDKYLNAVIQIINNAVEVKEPKENTKKDKKPGVSKYHYFRSYVKIGNKYFELRLDTEEMTDKKTGEMPAPVFISKIRKTAGKLNSPHNTSPVTEDTANNADKSIAFYLYDIFETKLPMPDPGKYIKDKAYRDAVNSGNIEKATEMLLEKAAENGYIKQSYFGEGSWAAPTAGVEKEQFTDLEALQQYVDDYGDEVNIYGIINGVQAHQEDYYFNPDRAGFHGQAASDTAQVLRKLRYNKADPDTKVTVYRAIPNDVKGEKLLAGDWIALSKAYCEEHGKNRYGNDNYHIIEEEVPISNIWQGSEDMREFGFDDGNKDVEKNVPNNRKLLEITYDENGYLIPLSKRFNENNPSILFQTAYHGSAADFDKFNTEQYGLSGEGSMSFGYGAYVAGNEEIARDYAERQFSQKFDASSKKSRLASLKERVAEDIKKLKTLETPEAYFAERDQAIERLTKELEADNAEGKTSTWKANLIKSIPEQYTEEKRVMYLKSLQASIEQDQKEIADLEAQIKEIESVNDPKRHLYTIDIPDNGYIKWDKTVPKATRSRIVNELYHVLIKGDYAGAERELRYELQPMIDTALSGQELYQNVWTYLGSDKEASQFLNKLGYTGIDYPAGTNFGTDIPDARNYVIFDDSDAKIVDHMLYQTQEELYAEAKTFETWQEFMEYYEVFGRPEVSPIPFDADAQWYQTTWELANKVTPEESINEAIVADRVEKEGVIPTVLDSMFIANVVSNDDALMDFLSTASAYNDIDLNSEEWSQVADAEEAAERDRIAAIKDYMKTIMYSANMQIAMNNLKNGKEISPNVLKGVRGEMRDNFKSRDFRALYAEIMGDEQYAVDEKDKPATIMAERYAKHPERYYDIVKPEEDFSRFSPEKRKQISAAMDNADIAAKIKSGKLKLDDEVYNYVKSLDKKIASLKQELTDQEIAAENDYKLLADAERRELLKLHDKMIIAKAKYEKSNDEITRKMNKGIRITSKYKRETQNLKANYDELYRKFSDLKAMIKIDAEVEAALKRQQQISIIKEEIGTKQKERSVAAEEKKLRIQLVKSAMRKIDFKRIDYEDAKTIIAIQRIFEPNLIGGVNRWIGTEGPYLRGVISQFITDTEYKENLLKYLRKNGKSSKSYLDFLELLEKTTSLEDFNEWTAAQRKKAIKYLPKENWIKELDLIKMAREREESIDLDIDTVEEKKVVYDEKTGDPKTYKDENGESQYVYSTIFKLQYSDEIAQRVKDAIGADMFDNMINVPFSEWTIEQLEDLAVKINALYKQGRDQLEGKKVARKEAADIIRRNIENTVKNTGIIINDDDDDETKKRKQEKINKILGLTDNNTKGSETSKNLGIKARMNRLLHSYNDANVLRVARILDGYSEATNVQELYRKEDTCYNNKTRSMNERAAKIERIMAENNITASDLATVIDVEVPNYVGNAATVVQQYTIDDLLYFAAAAEDYELTENGSYDDFAACSKNAVMYGNMFASTADLEAKQESAENDEIDEFGNSLGLQQYIARCNARFEKVLEAANNLDPKYKELAKAIAEDYAAQYDRMNKVSVEQFNSPVHRVKCYVPLNRLESNGDTNINRVKEDLLAAMGANATKQGVNKGMTARRVRINPLNQKPVVTGLYKTWADSVERTEHFIAYAEYVNELNRVYKNRDAQYTRQFIENRYGKGMIRYIDDYINEVANPNANKIREAGAELLHTLRGRTAPAYLAWKASAIVKQGLTSPWPFMQFINPAEYLSASWKMITSKGELYKAVKEKSVYMNNRVMDPMNDLIDEMSEKGKTKVDRFLGKQAQIGMSGLEWIDWVCVAPGWYAAYQKEYARLNGKNEAVYEATKARLQEENAYADYGTSEWKTAEQIEAEAQKAMQDDVEAKAVQYADDITRACQPSNRAVDLAPLFKNSSEAMKAYLQFQTSLNVIWQNIRYDIKYNAKQPEAVAKEKFMKISGIIIGYALAGIFMNSVMDGLGGDDDDDGSKADDRLKNLVYYATTQFTDAVPMIGTELTNTMDKLITGKQQFMNTGTDMTPTATKLLSILTNAKKGNWEKAADMTAEGIGMYLGLPVSGAKEVFKLLDIGDKDDEVGLNLGNVYGILNAEDYE